MKLRRWRFCLTYSTFRTVKAKEKRRKRDVNFLQISSWKHK